MAISVISIARPLAGTRTRRVSVVVASAVAVLLVAELAARFLVSAGAKPDSWNVTAVGVHIDQMQSLAHRTDGRPVALAVGSSIVGSDIDPARLSGVLGGGPAVYNGWLPGAPVRAAAFFADKLALPILKPQLVIIGVTPRDLNDSGTAQARMYEALLSSPEARRLTGTESLSEEAATRVSSWSALFRLRSVLRNPSAVASAIRHEGSAVTDANIATNGMDVERLDQPLRITDRHLAQERQAVSPFSLGTRELPALLEVAASLRQEGVKVLVVNMPVLEDVYFGMLPGGSTTYSDYRNRLQSSMAAAGVDYLDLAAQSWDRSLFADEDHLNGAGASRASDLVGAAISRDASLPVNGAPVAAAETKQ